MSSLSSALCLYVRLPEHVDTQGFINESCLFLIFFFLRWSICDLNGCTISNFKYPEASLHAELTHSTVKLINVHVDWKAEPITKALFPPCHWDSAFSANSPVTWSMFYSTLSDLIYEFLTKHVQCIVRPWSLLMRCRS